MVILGGASRAGKGIISNILMRETGLPYLSVDPIKMALARSVPEYPLNTEGTSIEVSTEMWPFLSELIKNMYQTGLDYIIEGEVLPLHVQELTELKLGKVISCFIGYSEISISKKIELIKKHSDYPNDWTSSLSDEQLITHVSDSIKHSLYLRDECEKLSIKYIDFSEDFEKAVVRVVDHVKSEIHNNRLHSDVLKLRP